MRIIEFLTWSVVRFAAVYTSFNSYLVLTGTNILREVYSAYCGMFVLACYSVSYHAMYV